MRSYGTGWTAESSWLQFFGLECSPLISAAPLSCTPSSYSYLIPSPGASSLHCLSTSPTVTGSPWDSLVPPLTHRQAHGPRARGRGRSVISPVLSLTWNIWHGDTSKERDFCVCVCVYVHNMWAQGCEVLQTGGGGKRTAEKLLFFFPLWALPESVQLPQWGGKKHQPGLKSRGQTGLAFVSAPVVRENTTTSFCLKSLQRQKGSSEMWILVVSSEVKMYLFARWWPCWVQWMSSSWHSVYTCRDY